MISLRIFRRSSSMQKRRNLSSRTGLPPVSPYGLIQETLWPDEWKILVSCILLNCTTRRAAEKVMPALFDRYPTADVMAAADPAELSSIIGILGFRNRRTQTLINMSKSYCTNSWRHASELPGIGSYASDAWEIFVLGRMPDYVPKDGALKNYYCWRKKHGI